MQSTWRLWMWMALFLMTLTACSGDDLDSNTSDGDDPDGDGSGADGDQDTDGTEIGDLCTPGVWFCYDDYSRWRCNENGSDYENLALCADNEVCQAGQCREAEAVCSPGQWECFDDTARWQCNDAGSDFSDPQRCGLNEQCLSGQCVPEEWICIPGENTCVDAQTRGRCNEYGNAYDDTATCPADSVCEEGECVFEPDGDDPDGDETDGDETDGDETDGDETDGDETDGDFDWDNNNTGFSACDDLSDSTLRACLESRIDGHHSLGYDNAKDAIYSDIDNHNGQVECVYTGLLVSTDGVPNSTLMNTEHSWPQSLGAGSEPARSDIFHLFPTKSTANSRRSNLPFCNVVTVDWQDSGSKLGWDASGNKCFEPRDVHKGDVARAIFYFSVRYNMAVDSAQETTLKAWNRNDPPSDYEEARNDAIESYQNNRNPFIDRPEFIDDIANF